MNDDGSLGASEFAATLNGDNPEAILQTLRRFHKLVAKERQQSLQPDDDEDDHGSSSSCEDEDDSHNTASSPPPTKKFKKSETWKEDTASYQVPFVGTSFAKGEAAPVIVGEWPSGLLKAYLTKSPMAVELINDELLPPDGSMYQSLNRKRKEQLSRSISKACLRCLAELVTACIPIARLQEEQQDIPLESSNDTPLRERPFFSLLMKKCCKGIFKLIVSEAYAMKDAKQHTKRAILGAALDLLQKISMVSTASARQVARYLDEELPEGVLKMLFKPSSLPKDGAATTTPPRQLRTRFHAIHLATTLFRSRDAAVVSYISTRGNRERKVKPGILFLAVREGLATQRKPGESSIVVESEEYYDHVADLLECCRQTIVQQSRLLSKRQWADLLSNDPWNHLYSLSSTAPPLSNRNTFSTVLAASDEYDDELDASQTAGVEARRLLFWLLSRPKTPPSPPSKTTTTKQDHEGQQIVSTMLRMLHQPSTRDNQSRLFCLHCLQQSPSLIAIWFNSVQIPDPKDKIAFLSVLRFVNSILSPGGPASRNQIVLDSLSSSDSSTAIDSVLQTILPRKLKNQSLTKALQSGNALVVAEALKFLLLSVQRVQDQITTLRARSTWKKDSFRRLQTQFFLQQPDLLVIWKSGFQKHTPSAVQILVYCLLESYCTFFPEMVQKSKIDVTTIVPNPADFFRSLPILQRKCLACFVEVARTQNAMASKWDSLPNILEIMVTTRSQEAYRLCRKAATDVMMSVLSKVHGSHCLPYTIEYEVRCWINGITKNCIPQFCTLMKWMTMSSTLELMATIEPILTTHGVSRSLEFSLFLSASLISTDVDSTLVPLVLEVATRMLLFLRSPIVLAELISTAADTSGSVASKTEATSLALYSKSVLDWSSVSDSDRRKGFECLLSDTLSKHGQIHALCVALHSADRSILYQMAARSKEVIEKVALARFLVHFCAVQNEITQASEQAISLLSQIVPDVIQKDKTILSDLSLIRDSIGEQNLQLLRLQLFSVQTSDEALPDFNWFETSRNLSLSEKNAASSVLLFSLTPHLRETATLGLLEQALLSEDNEVLNFFASFSKHTGAHADHTGTYSVDVLRRIFDAWWNLSSQNSVSLGEARFHFSTILSQVLDTQSMESTFVVSLLQRRNIREDLGQCLSNAMAPKHETAVFFAIVQSDPTTYLPIFFGLICDDLLQSFRAGELDCLLARIFEAGYIDNACLPDTLITTIINRIVTSQFDQRTRQLTSRMFCVAIHAVTRDKKQILAQDELTKCFLESLSSASGKEASHPQAWYAYEAIMAFLQYQHSITGEQLMKSSQVLASHIFVTCCVQLPRSVKSNEPRLTQILEWMMFLLSNTFELDIALLLKDSKTFTKLCKCCLKLGVSATKHPVHAASLKVLRLLFKKVHNSDAEWAHMITACESPLPIDLLTLVTTHSKFTLVVSNSESNKLVEATKTELVYLVDYCLEKAPDAVLSQEVLTVLCETFNAGLGKFDAAVHRLFYTISSRSEKVAVPFADMFRWGTGSNTTAGRRWDWMFDGLDVNRVQATVSNFPIQDTLSRYIQETDCESTNLADTSKKDTELKSHATPAAFNESDGSRRHERYSPVFLLPALFSSLEAVLVDETSLESSLFKDLDHPISTVLVPLIRGLFNKGVIGLCLASLSSECGRVRGLALAILGIMLKVIRTDEAHNVTSWRERPQLEMVLNAVQRAFVLKSPGVSISEIHALPPLVSTFLASASLAVSNVDNALFSPLNRYFLKSESEHGAFQDMSRLPAFVSLFCSSNGDPIQARKERLWALQMLCDGFVEGSSYHLVLSCHAPGLIMTAIANLPYSAFSDEMKGRECCLLLESLRTFLENGGKEATLHLIGKAGVLSWINSHLMGGESYKSWCPNLASQRELYSFISTATTQASLYTSILKPDNLRHEFCTLGQTLVEINQRQSFCNDNGSDSSNSTAFLECLHVMGRVLAALQVKCEISNQTNQHIGLSISSVCTLLENIPTTQGNRTLQTVCSFPWCCHMISTSSSCGTRQQLLLCTLLVSHCCENENDEPMDEVSMIMLLERLNGILLLLRRTAATTEPETNGEASLRLTLVELLLSHRRQFVISSKCRSLWYQSVTLTHAALDDKQATKSAQVAGALLESFSSATTQEGDEATRMMT